MKDVDKVRSREYGCVYIVVDRDLCKIGRSGYPAFRFKEIKAMNPFAVLHSARVAKNCGAIYLEYVVHETLKEYRVNGEWFYIDPEIALATVDHLLLSERIPPS